MNVLSLFSGIGGLELGLERAGMTIVGQVEIDPYCQRVLAKHWPNVPRHDDVKTAADWWLSSERPHVDLVCGGFPCQPFSTAGLRRGITDERWMWPAMADVVREVRPQYVVVENVGQLVRPRARQAFGWLLGDLAELGFDAEWSLLSARAVGAPHTRERLFVVAYPTNRNESNQGAATAATTLRRQSRGSRWVHHQHDWLPEPAVDRVADGLPLGMVRDPLHALGNAVVPQVAQHIGQLIMQAAA